jgi:hypothetical protein
MVTMATGGKPMHGLQPPRERSAAYNLPSEACVESPFMTLPRNSRGEANGHCERA